MGVKAGREKGPRVEGREGNEKCRTEIIGM